MPHSCFHRALALASVAALVLSAPALAAKVTCPDASYVIASGADLIAATAGVPPVFEIVGRKLSVVAGCTIKKGKAKPTAKGVRLSGKWKNCGDHKKLKLSGLIPAACDGVTGTISGRGVTPVPITGVLSLCGNGVVDAAQGEECDAGVACANALPCDAICRCGVGAGSTTTTLPQGGGVTVVITDAFCTADACTCGPLQGFDYHLQATGTASGPVGTELRVNVSSVQGGQLDCGGWSPIDTSVNPACGPIKCCRREAGQPEAANWAATEAIDSPCICPSAPPGFVHNYLGQAQLPPGGTPVEDEQTTSPCP